MLKENGELNKNIAVTTIMSNLGLYKALEREKIEYIKTQVGDKYVSEEIKNHGYSVGGEQSGHIILTKYATTGDGVLTSLKLIEAMVKQKMPLSLMFKDLIIFPQVLKNVRVKDKNTVLNDKEILEAIDNITVELGDSGRILVRPSGTEPLIRIMVEAENETICNKHIDTVSKIIEDKGYAE